MRVSLFSLLFDLLRLFGEMAAKHRQPTFRFRFGRFVWQNIPMLGDGLFRRAPIVSLKGQAAGHEGANAPLVFIGADPTEWRVCGRCGELSGVLGV